MKKIVFLGSKPIGAHCLAYLIQQQQEWAYEIVAVRTQARAEFSSDINVEDLARKHHIPILESLDAIPPCDIIYSVQHHEILQAQHIQRAAIIAVNLHLAPLPEYRGCNQFSFAIMDEATEFGVSIHQIDTQIDHGFLLFESRFPIAQDIWVADLYQQTTEAGQALFERTLADIVQGKYTLTDCTQLGRKSSLHFRNEIHALKNIDCASSEAVMDKTLRATSMPGFEMPYTIINGNKYYLINEKYKNK